jgi:glycine hydroxymethyltransferase
MAFTSGGHLSHGFGASLARSLYRIETYSVPSFSECLNLDEIEKKVREVQPDLIVAGCSAYPRAIPFEAIALLAKRYECRLLADISHTAGMVAAGLHAPVSGADFASMSLHKTMCGPRGGILLTHPHLRKRVDKAVFPGIQGALFPQLMAAKAVCLHAADTETFRELQQHILENARAMAEVFLDQGIALFTGGTDSQLLILRMEVAGSAPAMVDKLARVGILTNANYTFGDALGICMSGVRIGTTWISQLGFGADHSRSLAELVLQAMHPKADEEALGSRLMNLVEEVLC